jgi:hypothetical protein
MQTKYLMHASLRSLFDQFSEHHSQVNNIPEEHKGSLSHELIAGAGKQIL